MKITHTVFKNSDIVAACSPARIKTIELIASDVGNYRFNTGRVPNPNYIVINMDEPYIDEIIAVLKQHGHWD